MRIRWIILGLGGLIIVGLFAFPLWWPLVNVSSVSSALPGLADLPLAEQDLIEQIAADNMPFRPGADRGRRGDTHPGP